VLKIEHKGDTRGTPWYSNIVCVAVGQFPIAFPVDQLTLITP
jgi:hypothetical protein